MMESLHEVQISSLERIQQGKVRDMFRIDDEHMLIVTSDRISAFDVVLPDPIPGKGAVLTAVSNFWFQRMSDLIPNHMTELTLEEVVPNPAERELIAGRAVIVRRYQPLPVEAIVRGYLIGSGWKDYQRDGAVSGVQLPSGLQQADQLPETIFTPSTKADVGDHDENINFEQMVNLLDRDLGEQVRDISIEIYTRAAVFAKQRGIIIADTKFEFGLDDNGKLFLIDEVLTPDSSRFWPVDSYKPGISPPSFDKQFVRDYLETLDDWDKTPPGPRLPAEIIEKTAAKYREAQQRITET